MKRIVIIFLLLLLLSSCAESESIIFPYIIAGANGHPLLKYSTKSCTISTLCPDVYCEHLSSGKADEVCEFTVSTGYPVVGNGGIYYTRQSEPDKRMVYDLKYYDYANGTIRLISERDYLTGLFWHDGSLYWWEHFYTSDSDQAKAGSHLYRYDEKTGRITQLTDNSNYYESESAPWLGFPKLIYADDDSLYYLAYPELYRSDKELEQIETITLAELDVPDDAVLSYGNGYLHNGWQYRMTEGDICTLERQNVKTGETEVIAEHIVCFAMDETAVYWQPYYTENTETKSVGGVSRTNRSKGQILRYDLKNGETTEILNDPTLHFEEKLYLQDHVLMVRMYGTVVDPMDGSESYDVLPHALFYKDETWVKAEYDE